MEACAAMHRDRGQGPPCGARGAVQTLAGAQARELALCPPSRRGLTAEAVAEAAAGAAAEAAAVAGALGVDDEEDATRTLAEAGLGGGATWVEGEVVGARSRRPSRPAEAGVPRAEAGAEASRRARAVGKRHSLETSWTSPYHPSQRGAAPAAPWPRGSPSSAQPRVRRSSPRRARQSPRRRLPARRPRCGSAHGATRRAQRALTGLPMSLPDHPSPRPRGADVRHRVRARSQ
mmetsp:Transcript_2105/g.6362  ORF Transcript_2105/g.6362 Transcript_2105/m.6362 type:complete len:233 (+) Transcript_2105:370-1068(+)